MHLIKYLLLFAILLQGVVRAQLCVVNSTATTVSVLPSDTLDIDGSILGSQVLQVVRRSDTSVLGLTLAFDSLRIASITGLRPGMQVACHTTDTACTTLPDGNGFFRFCLTISNAQALGYSPGFPDYDSIEIVTENYFAIPDLDPFILDTFHLYYRVQNLDSSGLGFPERLSGDFQCFPNPSRQRVHLTYTLSAAKEVTVHALDALGREIWSTALGRETPGTHRLTVDAEDWPSGVYRIMLRAGGEIARHTFMKLD